jgi:hypothetical protein
METGSQIAIVRSIEAVSEESSRSFHDLLLIRSKERLASRRRRSQARLAIRKSWKGLGTSLRLAVGEATIFGGGAAVGAGIMLLKRGEPILGRPAIVIGVGVVMVALMILIRLMTSSRIIPRTPALGG